MPDDLTARKALLAWCRRVTRGYPGVAIRDFSGSWRDGRVLLALVHAQGSHLFSFEDVVRSQTARQNFELAFRLAKEHFGATPLMDPEGITPHYLWIMHFQRKLKYRSCNSEIESIFLSTCSLLLRICFQHLLFDNSALDERLVLYLLKIVHNFDK